MRPAALVLVALALLPAACGSDERQFDAEGAVAELNEAGAALELGESLPSSEEGVEVRTVSFADEEETGGGGSEHGHGAAGALVILEDAGAAQAEFERCGTAISFICFRAANAVLRFSEMDAAERARITTAVSALATEPS